MNQTNSVVHDKVRLTPHLVLLRARPDHPLHFKAGQFVIVPLPVDPAALAPSSWAPVAPPAKSPKGFYSIASAEQDYGDIELIIEHRDGYVSGWMDSRRPGDRLTLEGPLGKFGLSGQARPQAFLGFKAGIAPLRSMILSLLKAEFSAPIHLFLGEPELLFNAEWKALASRHPQFHYRSAADPAAALAAALPQRQGLDIYCAGFNREIEPMLASLEAAGFDKTLIKSEKFG